MARRKSGAADATHSSLDDRNCRARQRCSLMLKYRRGFAMQPFTPVPMNTRADQLMDPLDSPNFRPARLAAHSSPQGIAADLVAVLVAVTSGEPQVS